METLETWRRRCLVVTLQKEIHRYKDNYFWEQIETAFLTISEKKQIHWESFIAKLKKDFGEEDVN